MTATTAKTNKRPVFIVFKALTIALAVPLKSYFEAINLMMKYPAIQSTARVIKKAGSALRSCLLGDKPSAKKKTRKKN